MADRIDILVKMREERRADGERKILETKRDSAGARLVYDGALLTVFDSFITPDRELRQSFPGLSRRLRTAGLLGPSPTMPEALDLFLRLRLPISAPPADVDALIAGVRAVREVAYAFRSPPVVSAQAPDLRDDQVYLRRACPDPGAPKGACAGGVDALYSWKVAGGAGQGVRVCLCETAFCAAPPPGDPAGPLRPVHEDLPAVTLAAPLPAAPYPEERLHGTMSLGVLAARDDVDPDTGAPRGITGICHGADEILFSTTGSGGVGDVDTAIDRVLSEDAGLAPLGAGDVLILNKCLDLAAVGYAPGLDEGPVEIDPAVRAAIQGAVALHVTVLEAAGNKLQELVAVHRPGEDPDWDPDESSAAFTESGAIVVGAGVPGTSADRHAVHSRTAANKLVGSNHGGRVDCQGWGDEVVTTGCGPDNLSQGGQLLWDGGAAASYVANYRDTSAATAMIGGVCACLQGAYAARHHRFLEPWEIRTLLRKASHGSAQRDRTWYPAASYPIGPLPDLAKLLRAVGIAPDLHVRDHVGDDGARGADPPPPVQTSPDIVVRTAPLQDPAAELGRPHWDEEPPVEPPAPGSTVFVYVRARNRGTAPGFAAARVWTAPPSPFVHPRDFRPVATVRIPELEARAMGVSTERALWRVPAAPDRPAPALVVELDPDRETVTHPTASSTTLEAMHGMRSQNSIAVRNVQEVAVRAGRDAVFFLRLRGGPDGPLPYSYLLRPHLPPGTRVVLEADAPVPGPDGTLLERPAPSRPLKVTDPPPFGTGPLWLDADADIGVTVRVTPPPGAAPGTWVSTVDQRLRWHALGRRTLILKVL